MTAAQNNFSDQDYNTAFNNALSFMNGLGPQRVITIFYYQSYAGSGMQPITINNFVVVYWQD
jgi:hypothetical protein